MKPFEIPSPVLRKLEHSKHHLDVLDSLVCAHLEPIPELVAIHKDEASQIVTEWLKGNPIRDIVPFTCGDFMQNLRSVLDYLVAELARANHQKPGEYDAFPICKSAAAFKEAKKSKLSKVCLDAVACIERMQPYTFGKGKETHSSLFVLDELTNINKHRHIILTAEGRAPVSLIQMSDPSGTVRALNPYPALDSQASIRTIVAALEAQVDTQVAVFVQIGEGSARGAEVVSLASQLFEDVRVVILPQFERFF